MVFLKSPKAASPSPDLSEALGEANAIALNDKLLQLSLTGTKALNCDRAVFYPLSNNSNKRA
jgi:hypothetical protein